MHHSIQSNPRPPWRLAVLAAAMLVALAAFAGAARAANYVALGDSYAAGPIVPNQIAPFGCLKSDHNYAAPGDADDRPRPAKTPPAAAPPPRT